MIDRKGESLPLVSLINLKKSEVKKKMVSLYPMLDTRSF